MRGMASLPRHLPAHKALFPNPANPARLERLERPFRVRNRQLFLVSSRLLLHNRRRPKAFRRHPLAGFSSRVPHSELKVPTTAPQRITWSGMRICQRRN
jgi:hypothetical protein